VIATAARVVAGSAALQSREREIVDASTRSLAALVAEETRAGADDVEPRVVASALMGAQRALVAHVHERVLAGMRGRKLANDVKAQGERAFAVLERGLGGYGVKQP
jgi:hypothetical protein